MRHIYSCALALAVLLTATTATAQTSSKWREMHKVKKKETLFGISQQYGITVDELKQANPEMNAPDYKLKKGYYIFIPYPASAQPAAPEAAKPAPAPVVDDITRRPLRLGVMLPLHDQNGDGRRMLEYYRGVLMGLDTLKHEGISVDVHAWNVAENFDVQQVLRDSAAARCDLILGPLYSAQMQPLSDFVAKHDTRLVIPFSINAPQLQHNPHIYQVYQSAASQNDAAVSLFMGQFQRYHTVIIDCNDSTSTKGIFTSAVRRQLEAQGREYSITNLKSSEAQFLKAFSRKEPNVVILNTGRLQELNVAFAKLSGMTIAAADVLVTMYGYPEWLTYTRNQLENFYRFNVYIPTPYFLNPLSPQARRFQSAYRAHFHQDMQNVPQRFAAAGFDHTVFFLRGLHQRGRDFNGERGQLAYRPLQSALQFERVGSGGWQNRAMLLVHYTPEHKVETIE